MTIDAKGIALESILVDLKLNVIDIDRIGVYPIHLLKQFAKHDFYQVKSFADPKKQQNNFSVIEKIAEICVTTAFVHWCHLVSMLYIERSNNCVIKENVLPKLKKGEIFGTTGLSNGMKYYAGMEKVLVKATPSKDGFILNGMLPYISNLAENNLVAIIAEVSASKRIIAFIPANLKGIHLQEKNSFIGLNGTSTYSMRFNDVFISDHWLLDEDADKLIATFRNDMVYYQIAIILGLIKASISSIEKVQQKQNGINNFAISNFVKLQEEYEELSQRAKQLILTNRFSLSWSEVIRLRRDSAISALKITQAELLHYGAAAYKKGSSTERRLREAQFLAIVTPAIKQLEKMLRN